MQKVLTIFGPTASNKTVLSLHVAKQLPGPTEIISADSVQIYKYLDIGSNKPSKEQLQQVKHHLISSIDPSQGHINAYSAIDFRDEASAILKANQDKTNIIVGGCSYYLQHLLFDFASPPEGNLQTRISIEERLRKDGWEESLKRLEKIDPIAAQSVDKFNYRRLARLLEIFAVSNRKPTEFKKPPTKRYDFRAVTLIPTVRQLNDIIGMRCEKMIETGLFEEVFNLVVENKLILNSGASKAIGYKDVLDFLFTAKYPTTTHEFLSFLIKFKGRNRKYASEQINFARRYFGNSFYNVSVEKLLDCKTQSEYQEELQKISNQVIALYNMSMEEYDQKVQAIENQKEFELFLEKQHIHETLQAKRLYKEHQISKLEFKDKIKQVYDKVHVPFLYSNSYVLRERVEKLNQLLKQFLPLREKLNYSRLVIEAKGVIPPSVIFDN